MLSHGSGGRKLEVRVLAASSPNPVGEDPSLPVWLPGVEPGGSLGLQLPCPCCRVASCPRVASPSHGNSGDAGRRPSLLRCDLIEPSLIIASVGVVRTVTSRESLSSVLRKQGLPSFACALTAFAEERVFGEPDSAFLADVTYILRAPRWLRW